MSRWQWTNHADDCPSRKGGICTCWQKNARAHQAAQEAALRKAFDAWRSSSWTVSHPQTRIMTEDAEDRSPGRHLLRTRVGIWIVEEMHIKDEEGQPIGELKVVWPFVEPRGPGWLTPLKAAVETV